MDISSWHSYPKIYALGHAAIANLLKGDVIVEEKVDGSQFSFGRFDGELRCKSRNCDLVLDAAGMFQKGVDHVATLLLKDGWTYRAEFLQKNKHNALTYSRTPVGHVILFDVSVGHEYYLSREDKEVEAQRLGLEIVPTIPYQRLDFMDDLKLLLDRESILGGCKIEGIVIKNYSQFCKDGHVVMGKFVSEAFKETHRHEWGDANPQSGDIIQSLISCYRTEARWQKAVEYQRSMLQICDEPKDIGGLIKRVQADIIEECEDEIKDVLWKWAKDKITRGSVAGLAEWYKELLAKRQFGE